MWISLSGGEAEGAGSAGDVLVVIGGEPAVGESDAMCRWIRGKDVTGCSFIQKLLRLGVYTREIRLSPFQD